ncbi:hypothetical protein CW304_01885 [Bacillus sp. UFRGS-B20]|nr:hypothetical protein CW304_01885 [Bacillus sp. UFRGS-B20]
MRKSTFFPSIIIENNLFLNIDSLLHLEEIFLFFVLPIILQISPFFRGLPLSFAPFTCIDRNLIFTSLIFRDLSLQPLFFSFRFCSLARS